MAWRKWMAGVLTVAALLVAAGGVRSVMAQDAAKGGAQAGKDGKDKMDKAKGEHVAATKKALEASKTSLGTAIANAEKEMKGKAFEANIRATKDGKPIIHVNLIVGDEMVRTLVDPDSGKVTKNDKEGPEGGN